MKKIKYIILALVILTTVGLSGCIFPTYGLEFYIYNEDVTTPGTANCYYYIDNTGQEDINDIWITVEVANTLGTGFQSDPFYVGNLPAYSSPITGEYVPVTYTGTFQDFSAKIIEVEWNPAE